MKQKPWRYIYEKVSEDVALLVENGKWEALRGYFKYFKDEDEQACKTLAWCKFFLSHYFKDPTPDFQFTLVKKYLSEKNEYIAAPRGFSKTTLIQGVTACVAANEWKNFIVIIEKSFTEAAEVMSVIRQEFMDNPLLKKTYGNMVATGKDGKTPDKAKDTEGDILLGGVRIRAKGFNTPIRGLKSAEHRPDLIFLDDVESEEHIFNVEQRRKYMERFTAGVIPALDPIVGTAKITGTIIHMDSMLKSLIDQHKGLILRAFEPSNPEGTLLWPKRWTYKLLMRKKEEMEMEGHGGSKFCNPHEAPILMADFTMKPIGEVKVGDEIIGFTVDRWGNSKGCKRNKLVKTVVKKTFTRRAKTVNLRLSNGDRIRCTPEHRWFTGRYPSKSTPGRRIYAPAKVGSQILQVIKRERELTIDQMLDYRYLAGMIDGEGACKHGSIQICQSRDKNRAVYDEIEKVLKRLEIPFRVVDPCSTKTSSSFVIAGGKQIKSEILWYGDPAKKEQIVKNMLDKPANFVREKPRVERIEDHGEEDVFALETGTGNYVVWGYASSNSQEYLNEPLDDDSRRFHMHWLGARFNPLEIKDKARNRYVCFDVADAKGDKNDYTFCVVVDIDQENNWYVQHAKQRRVDTKELIDWIFNVWEFWKPIKIGVEKKAFEYQVYPLLKEQSEETGVYPVTEQLKDGGKSKEQRVVGALQGRLESGKIYFKDNAKDDTNFLIGQLYDFPRGRFDDGPDSLAYISNIGTRPFGTGTEDLLPKEHQEFYEHRKRGDRSRISKLVSKL